MLRMRDRLTITLTLPYTRDHFGHLCSGPLCVTITITANFCKKKKHLVNVGFCSIKLAHVVTSMYTNEVSKDMYEHYVQNSAF